MEVLGRPALPARVRSERGAPLEKGQVLILWVLAATVILVIGAIVVDVGLWLTERRRAQMAADFAALAAATELKNPAPAAELKGQEFAARNGFDDRDSDVEVKVHPNYNNDPDMVEVTIKQGSPLLFAGIFNVGAFDIGARAVGTDPVEDVDVVMIFDRTQSIEGESKTPQDEANAKNGAKAALEVLDPGTRHVALGVFWASNSLSYPDSCSAGNTNFWVPVSFSSDYNDGNGNLNPSSLLVQTIECLQLSNLGTNLGAPIHAAVSTLQGGRPSARKAIILLVDTAAQQPSGNACQSAVDEANIAKAQGIEIFTIGFAVEGDECQFDNGAYSGAATTELLADIATNSDVGMNPCESQPFIAAENADGDHFFCQRRQGQLAPVFTLVAQALAREFRLEE